MPETQETYVNRLNEAYNKRGTLKFSEVAEKMVQAFKHVEPENRDALVEFMGLKCEELEDMPGLKNIASALKVLSETGYGTKYKTLSETLEHVVPEKIIKPKEEQM